MSELGFSVIARSLDELAHTHTLVERFSKRYNIPVQIQDLTWDTARQELNQVAMYNQGVDVSQVGSTWLRGFVDMNAVHVFDPIELRRIGNTADFVPAAWENAMPHADGRLWAVPWLVDARILFYRRDWLKRAGVEESTAFATPQALDETLRALRASGVEVPLTLPTQFSWRTLHNVASWIWGAGGDFISRDGKHICFMEPSALAGFKHFFNLARHLPDSARRLSDAQADAMFIEGQAAVTIAGPWIMEMPVEQLVNVGVAAPPGPAFIGGSHLIIWKHSPHLRQALQLVNYLVSVESQRNHGLHGLLPARFEALNAADIPTREFSRYLQQVLREGRSFPPIHLWALIEERLTQALTTVWEDVLALPEVTDAALDGILEQRLGTLAGRLEMMFI